MPRLKINFVKFYRSLLKNAGQLSWHPVNLQIGLILSILANAA